MVLIIGKIINIFEDYIAQKCFYYKLNEVEIAAIYERESMRLFNVVVWESTSERVAFLKKERVS